ncbi:hypothetical protein AGABI2DRAFT_195266, partial [Agaricus bisporus var. bisporus H97]|uniref:hypothetical protein n=1 Tax=Agaricus bisporus var. bisporus (strain H97 / ATCC MYA-4626 / FGSC 10389) TaxID=936046 RepID=UPI00029F5564
NLSNDYSHDPHSQPLTHLNASTSTQAHVPATVGSSRSRYDGATTSHARAYPYTSSSDKQGSIDDEEGDVEDEGAEKEEEVKNKGPGRDR